MDLLRKRIGPELDGASVVSGSKGGRFRAVDGFDDDDEPPGVVVVESAASSGQAAASVAGGSVAGRSTISKLSRVTTANTVRKISDQEKAAFTHACPDIHTDVCKAIAMFVKTSAVQCGAPEGKAYYCFVLKLVQVLHSWASKAKADASLGDVARQLGAYPCLAYNILSSQTLHDDPVRRIVDLVNTLDGQLPCTDRKVSIAGRTECTRLAARAGIPFAFGLRDLIPNTRLDFLLKNIDRGELKAVRYSLAFVMKGKGTEEEEDEDDEDEDEDEETAAGGGAGAAVKAEKAVEAKPVLLRDEMSEAVFMSILDRTPRTHTFELLHAFGLHYPGSESPPYQTISDPGLRDKILKGEPVIPPCRGSVLRAYVRSVLDVNVDTYEPDIQTVSDCVLGFQVGPGE